MDNIYKEHINLLLDSNKYNVYLCGPIGKTTPWRHRFKNTSSINFVNPEDWYYEDYITLCSADLYAINRCDCVLAYIPIFSPGTCMELWNLKDLDKPIFCCIHKKCRSPWYDYAIFGSGKYKNRFVYSNLKDTIKKFKSFVGGLNG